MDRFFSYLRETRGELKHVSWPTQRQTAIFTVLVIVISIVTALYLGLLDFLLTEGLSKIV